MLRVIGSGDWEAVLPCSLFWRMYFAVSAFLLFVSFYCVSSLIGFLCLLTRSHVTQDASILQQCACIPSVTLVSLYVLNVFKFLWENWLCLGYMTYLSHMPILDSICCGHKNRGPVIWILISKLTLLVKLVGGGNFQSGDHGLGRHPQMCLLTF